MTHTTETAEPTLTVGAANDAYEQQANAVAGQIMRMPEQPFVQRKCAHCQEKEQFQRKPMASFIQRKTEAGGSQATQATTSQIQATQGGGNPLPATTRTFMETRFGTDFSGVNIHTGEYAVQLSRELNAQAFTVGSDIYFNSGKYAPDSMDGRHLLAHELTHTVQQSSQSPIHRIVQRQHEPGGPYHPPEGTDLRCTSTDTCSQLSLKINYLRHTILRHQQWDIANPTPDYPNGRHAVEIAELQNALANCIGHTVRCRNQPTTVPVPENAPARSSAATRRIATATAVGAGIGMVGGAILGALGGGVGGTLVAPGVGTVGGGAAGGVAGAAYGAGLGGLVGGAVMGGAQALWEWLSD
ncbi:eCIS core domain-containing protein [Spirosoma radiotolerans]|uniref:eCIS core domain-containing protein n=1 Tax=Spirosoma radiotolerans TaxID=1379870 RepID=UPI000697B363|nr:DUF4157 domain-containing protein [Spirosoma radiotolerans]